MSFNNPATNEFLEQWVSSSISLHESVYEPAGDSFLLLDSLSLLELSGRSVLDMGTGSGIVGIYAALRGASQVVSTDINPEALECADRNAGLFGVKPDSVRSDLFSAITRSSRFDIICFNPPYLPSECPDAPTVEGLPDSPDGPLTVALDGGSPDGSLVIWKFIEEFYPYMETGGSALLPVSSLNDPPGLASRVEELYGDKVSWRILKEDSFFFEKLFCIELRKEM